MKKINRFMISLAGLLASSCLAIAVPASAVTAPSGIVSGRPPISPVPVVTAQGSDSGGSAPGNNLITQFHQQAQGQLAADRAKIKTHTQAERQKNCQARQTALTNRMNTRVKQAQKIQSVFDGIYSKVKAFHDSKQLNVADYASLVAKADTAKANATASITALQSLDVTIDCSQPNVADTVSTFQQAVGASRDSLKSYRAAIVDLINSLKGASSAQTNSTGSQ